MVETVLDFIQQNPQVSTRCALDPATAVASVGQGQVLGTVAFLGAVGQWQPYFLSTLAWSDNGYSTDLAELFLQVFARQTESTRPKDAPFTAFYNNYIDYSVGDFLEPNPSEATAVGLFLASNPDFREQPQLLALPAGVQPARRFLRCCSARTPGNAQCRGG